MTYLHFFLRWSATPGIPIIETAVKYLQNGRFKAPAPMEKMVIHCEPGICATPVPGDRTLRRISPEEEHFALILATARDVTRGVNVPEWAFIWRSQPCTFRVVSKLSLTSVSDPDAASLFFEASRLREKVGEDFESMYLTTVACQFCHCRRRRLLIVFLKLTLRY